MSLQAQAIIPPIFGIASRKNIWKLACVIWLSRSKVKESLRQIFCLKYPCQGPWQGYIETQGRAERAVFWPFQWTFCGLLSTCQRHVNESDVMWRQNTLTKCLLNTFVGRLRFGSLRLRGWFASKSCWMMPKRWAWWTSCCLKNTIITYNLNYPIYIEWMWVIVRAPLWLSVACTQGLHWV